MLGEQKGICTARRKLACIKSVQAERYAGIRGSVGRRIAQLQRHSHGAIPDDLARQLKRSYYAAISYMDAQLGKAPDEFDRLELRDNPFNRRWP